MKRAIIIILLVLTADQWLKFWVKLNMSYGEVIPLIGDWCKLRFIENPGMAFGLAWGGETGKLLLTLFRIVAVIGIAWYLNKLVSQKRHRGLIACMALIFAGAMGNIIDSAFYGLIWNMGTVLSPTGGGSIEYVGMAQLTYSGYASFLHGSVVDMFYFPLIEDARYPDWFPFVGGRSFTFFSAIFNIADASITVGVACLIFFQKRFYAVPEGQFPYATTAPARPASEETPRTSMDSAGGVVDQSVDPAQR
ncbi:MAG: lipoprotein signal peptidase [Flavobacteriales bacterium]|nr:lipoprotein signal peptidase [Flavobacteriales bacterium]